MKTSALRAALVRLLIVTLAVTACDAKTESAPDSSAACTGAASGGSRLTFRSDIHYSVAYSDGANGPDSMVLRAVFVGRGAPGWSERPEDPTGAIRPPAGADSAGFDNGGNLGRLWVGHNRARTEALVGADRIVMDTFNVFLVDRIDSVGGPPAVVGRLRLQPGFALPTGVCGQRATGGFNPIDSLEALLLRTPEVRDFASERGPRVPVR